MSDTPKTDAAEFEVFDGQNLIAVVEAEFARQLEIEMKLKIAYIAGLERQLEAFEYKCKTEQS